MKNGRGIVFPGDKIDLYPVTNKTEAYGIVITDEEAKSSNSWEFGCDLDKWLWFRIYHTGYPNGFIIGYTWWTAFDAHGGIEKHIISRGSGVVTNHSKSQSSCNHLSIKKVFIGVGASGSEIEVCTTCKEEV